MERIKNYFFFSLFPIFCGSVYYIHYTNDLRTVKIFVQTHVFSQHGRLCLKRKLIFLTLEKRKTPTEFLKELQRHDYFENFSQRKLKKGIKKLNT